MIETYENQLEQICLLHAGQSEAQLVLRHAAQYAEDILFHENSGGNDKPKSETFWCVVDACVLLQLARACECAGSCTRCEQRRLGSSHVPVA